MTPVEPLDPDTLAQWEAAVAGRLARWPSGCSITFRTEDIAALLAVARDHARLTAERVTERAALEAEVKVQVDANARLTAEVNGYKQRCVRDPHDDDEHRYGLGFWAKGDVVICGHEAPTWPAEVGFGHVGLAASEEAPSYEAQRFVPEPWPGGNVDP